MGRTEQEDREELTKEIVRLDAQAFVFGYLNEHGNFGSWQLRAGLEAFRALNGILPNGATETTEPEDTTIDDRETRICGSCSQPVHEFPRIIHDSTGSEQCGRAEDLEAKRIKIRQQLTISKLSREKLEELAALAYRNKVKRIKDYVDADV
jgi:hypothetical protein